MFKNTKYVLFSVLAAVMVIAVGASATAAYAAGGAPGPARPAVTSSQGNGTSLAVLPAASLSAEEAAGLLFMREEEKLARDVYNAMYKRWGTSIFQTIAASEQQHMNQIKVLLDRYGLADPALGPGKFTDPALQALYDQLIAQGSVSRTAALQVGVTIEKVDIADLKTHLAETDNLDIQRVYTNLMYASNNHLRAFNKLLGVQ